MSAPKAYKKRKQWVVENMSAAVTAVREKRMGFLKASKYFKVPRTTLFRLVSDKNTPTQQLVTKKIGRKLVFDDRLESLLVKYALTMESKLYGLTQLDLRRLAYQLAVMNNVSHPFNDGAAGRYWCKGFLSRNKNLLSLRKPTGTSFARAHGFTKERMKESYDNLDKVYNEKKFTADRIFNVDESGISTVQSKFPKIIARRGKKQIGAMTSAERGSLITVVLCMSAGGIFVPPMVIFPRKNMTEALMRGAPVGSIGRAHPSGWIQTYLFTEWFKHFLAYTKPSETSPILLLLDGHQSHVKNIEIIDLARANHVTIVSLPPHCTHKVQPLDRAFMSTLKTYYSEAVRIWLRENNRPLTAYDIVELFGNAYRKCQTGEIADKGFRVGGIYPFNRHIFSEADYLAAEQEAAEEQESCGVQFTSVEPGLSSEHLQQDEPRLSSDNFQNNPSTSSTQSQQAEPDLSFENLQQDKPGPSTKRACNERHCLITPFDISPVPMAMKRTSKRVRKSAKSEILTSSPYKNELQEAERKRTEKDQKVAPLKRNKREKKVQGKKKPGSKSKQKQTNNEDTDSDDASIPYGSDSSVEVGPSEELSIPTNQETICFFCDEKFSNNVRGEQWVQSLMCELWVHSECAGYESGTYICDYCK